MKILMNLQGSVERDEQFWDWQPSRLNIVEALITLCVRDNLANYGRK